MKDNKGNIFGATDMLDIAYLPVLGDMYSSSAGHTVLGRYIDTDFQDSDILKSIVGKIPLGAGDIVAIETEFTECAIGNILIYGNAEVQLI
jgi:hypothetical protein